MDRIPGAGDARRMTVGSVRGHLKDVSKPLPGVFEPLPGWQPSILAPVFHGRADHLAAGALRSPARVFYPSLSGSPQDAAMLTGVGRFPVVIFLHGMCRHEPEMYRRWDLLPAQLARSGYVVIVPKLSSLPPYSDAAEVDIATAVGALRWLRTEWTHRDQLLPEPMTAVVGHSWGALLGGALTQRMRPHVSAYASLSGGWAEWPQSPPSPLTLDVPSLFAWGTGSTDGFSSLHEPNDSILSAMQGAIHQVVFRGGEHWDYLPPGAIACETVRGPCTLVRPLAADFVTSFLSHYVPPEKWSSLTSTIPHSLVAPPLAPTAEQQFYAGGHLQGLAAIAGAGQCSVTSSWRVPPSLNGAITLGAD